MSPGHWVLLGPQWDRVTLLGNDTWPKSTPSPDQPPHPLGGLTRSLGGTAEAWRRRLAL